MYSLTLLFQQLSEHLDFTYDVHQIKNGIVINTPFLDQNNDRINVYIETNVDQSMLLFDDDQNINNEFTIAFGKLNQFKMQKYDFKNDHIADTILKQHLIIPTFDQRLQTTCPIQSDFDIILRCIHQIEAVQIAMATYLNYKIQFA